MENIIVGVILIAAAAFTIYRLFVKRTCGCGSDCGCSTNSAKKTQKECCSGSDGQCNCGK